MIETLLRAGKYRILSATAILIVVTSLADWLAGRDFSVAVWYALPVMVGSLVLRRAGTAVLAVFCSYVHATFATTGSAAEFVLRFIVAATAYGVSGIFVAELARNRDGADEQLRVLAESSPAAILTIDHDGTVLAANHATHRLFLIPKGDTIQRRSIRNYLPMLAEALLGDMPPGGLRVSAQCQGARQNGELFLAHTWFSSYATSHGQRLTAIVVDSSEEMREREERGLQELMAGNRIVAGALAHEVRNFCGALTRLCENLGRRDSLALDPDLQAMVSLVEGLGSLASLRLQSRPQEIVGAIPLKEVLDNLRIVIEAEWREIEGTVHWRLPASMPEVFAEPHGLLQAFLNLSQNSLRAVRPENTRQLIISVSKQAAKVTVRFEDTGPGVSDPQTLFQPFQSGALGSGLGLYVSRSIVRSYGGDVRFEPQASGCCFAVELETAVQRV